MAGDVDLSGVMAAATLAAFLASRVKLILGERPRGAMGAPEAKSIGSV